MLPNFISTKREIAVAGMSHFWKCFLGNHLRFSVGVELFEYNTSLTV